MLTGSLQGAVGGWRQRTQTSFAKEPRSSLGYPPLSEQGGALSLGGCCGAAFLLGLSLAAPLHKHSEWGGISPLGDKAPEASQQGLPRLQAPTLLFLSCPELLQFLWGSVRQLGLHCLRDVADKPAEKPWTLIRPPA